MNNDIKNILIKELGINDKNIGNILYDNKEIFITLIAQNEQDKVIIDLKDKIISAIGAKYKEDKVYVSFSVPKTSPSNLTKKTLQNIKHIICISSGKGGVGKSTVAFNLAYAIQSLNYRVGILDGDIYGPSIDHMMGEPDSHEYSPTSIKTFIKNSLVFNSVATFMKDKNDALSLKAPIATKLFNQMLEDSQWGNLDFLIIDLPPGTGDLHINLALKYNISGAIVVCTPQKLALLDAQKAINMWKKTNVPILGSIENMSSFVCEKCNHISHIFHNRGLMEMSQTNNINYLGDIPLDITLRQYGDNQKNIIVENKSHLISQIFIDFASKITKNLQKQPIHNL